MAAVCTVQGCYAYGRYCRLHNVQTVKPAKPVNKESDSMKESMKVYKKESKKYITLHPKCEVKGCNKVSECIHHRAGRIGDNLTDSKNFMAVCLDCHRWIEEHPKEAKGLGYSVSRLEKTM